MSKPETVIVRNINVPGYESRVNTVKYGDMRAALLRALPAGESGLAQTGILVAIQPLLPQTLRPSGENYGWWVKTVRIDLEASGQVKRNTAARPTR